MESVYALTLVLTLTAILSLNLTCANFLLDEERTPDLLKRHIIRQLHAIYLLIVILGGFVSIVAWGGLHLQLFTSPIWNWVSSLFITLMFIGIFSALSSPLGKSRYMLTLYAISSITTIALVCYAWFVYTPPTGG